MANLNPVSAAQTAPSLLAETYSARDRVTAAAIFPCSNPDGDIFLILPWSNSYRKPSSGIRKRSSAVRMSVSTSIVRKGLIQNAPKFSGLGVDDYTACRHPFFTSREPGATESLRPVGTVVCTSVPSRQRKGRLEAGP